MKLLLLMMSASYFYSVTGITIGAYECNLESGQAGHTGAVYSEWSSPIYCIEYCLFVRTHYYYPIKRDFNGVSFYPRPDGNFGCSCKWGYNRNVWLSSSNYQSCFFEAGPCLKERAHYKNCTQYHNWYRTIDGTCNNLCFPTWGSSETALRRLMAANYVDGLHQPRGFSNNGILPTANEVSRAIFKIETTNPGNSDGLTVLFMTFGQFLDHDITEVKSSMPWYFQNTSGSCPDIAEAFKLPSFPIFFNSSSTACTPFARSLPICPKEPTKLTERQQRNELTAFVDASQIYGAKEELSNSLRKLDGSGEMKVQQVAVGNLLPHRPIQVGCKVLGGCSLVGDDRGDENIPLHAMHTLWIREHNRIARAFKQAIPGSASDEYIFQSARKIVGALWQHITYEEYIPSLVRLSPYSGYKSDVDPSITNEFATAAFRYGHSLVPNSFQVKNNQFQDVQDSKNPIPLQEAFRNRAPINSLGIERFLYGIIGSRANGVDNSFADGIGRKLFVPPGVSGHADLMALNIQRGRDHGIQKYLAYRWICNLPTINSWEDLKLFMLPSAVDSFREIYDQPSQIDLFAGGISEKHIEGLEVGPTFACIIRKQFEAVRDGDYFFYKNPGVFTADQLNAIEKVTLSAILCENLRDIVKIQRKALRVRDPITNDLVDCNLIQKLDLDKFINRTN